MAAHNIPYVAQTTFIGNFKDFHEKAHRAIYTEGPAFVNVMSPCPRGWQYPTEMLPEICKMAVETCVWPLYEIIDGEWHPGGDQQMGSRIVEGEIDYLFFFTDPMTLQPHDTDVKALTRLAGVENIVFCCNRSTADHIISSPLFLDPTYKRIHPDYTNYTQRFENKEIVSEAVERVKKRMSRNENNMIE